MSYQQWRERRKSKRQARRKFWVIQEEIERQGRLAREQIMAERRAEVAKQLGLD